MRAIVKLNAQTESRAHDTIMMVIKQAQSGVTNFSAGGILANILFDLEYDYLDGDGDE